MNHFSNLPIRAGKCRMKMGLILTGGGDKVRNYDVVSQDLILFASQF